MKSEELLRHLGSVDDKYIAELFTDSISSAKPQSRKPKWALIAACLAVVLIGSIAVFGRSASDGITDGVQHDLPAPVVVKNSRIMIDVNPSVSIEVNSDGTVEKLILENEDAEAMLSGLELVGKNYESAISDIVKALNENGYITKLKNSLLITVLNEDKETANAVRNKAVSAVISNSALDYDLSVLSQIMTDDSKYVVDADRYGISTGRMWLIKKTNDMNVGFIIDNLAIETVHTLNQLYEYTGLPKLVERVGTAAGTAPKNFIEKMNVDSLSAEEIVGVVKQFSDYYDNWNGDDADKEVEDAYNYAASKTEDTEEILYIVSESLNILTKAGERISTAAENSSDPNAKTEPIITSDDVTKIADFVVQIVEYFD